jgi:amino acid adenylation domain-containing protein
MPSAGMRTDYDYNEGEESMSAHRQLEARIDESPECLAVIDGTGSSESVSFSALGELIDQAAQKFVAAGLCGGDRLMIVSEPSLGAVVAMFAGWSLDLITVPLDVDQPSDRFAQLLTTIRPSAVVSNHRDDARTNCANLPLGVTHFDLDALCDRRNSITSRGDVCRADSLANDNLANDDPASDDPASDGPASDGPANDTPANDTPANDSLANDGPTNDAVAYIVHTSGSTGRPKGIEITQGNLSAQLIALDSILSPTPGRFLAATPLSFDPSLVEVVWALTRGWTVVTASPSIRLDPHHAADLVRRHNITHLQFTPTIAHLWMEQNDAMAALGGLSQLLIGGEVLTETVATGLLSALTHGELINLYGPSETTVWATGTKVRTPIDATLGYPLAGYQVQLRDTDEGIGELWIGGDGVGRGYHQLPNETADRFVTDENHERWYRTGDLAEFTEHGYVFHGRIDHQIKLSGQRIELSGVESLCEQVPGIRRAVAVAEGNDDDLTLVAYLEADVAQRKDSVVLEHLAKHLPRGQHPTLRWVNSVPLTPSGKADRSELTRRHGIIGSIETRMNPADSSAVIPIDLASRVESAWARVLRRSIPSRDSDFFELGGHSVLAARMVAQLNREFKVRIGLATCAQYPKLSDFIEAVRSTLAEGPKPLPSLVAIRPGDDPVVFVHGRDGNIIDLRFLATSVPAYRGAVALQARGLDGIEAPHHSLGAMAEDYLSELAAANIMPSVLVGYSGGGLTVLEMAHRLEAEGRPPSLVILLDTEAPDLAPPTRLQRGLRRLEPGIVSFASFTRQWARDRKVHAAGQLTELERDLDGLVDIGAVADIVYRNATIQPIASPILLIRAATRTRPWDLGWSRRVTGRFAVIDVPGDHVTMLRPPQVQHVAKAIRIATVQADSSSGRALPTT